ncbi:N-acetyl-gamma-glutamyl-phosphate reductase [Thermodesulfobacteriota bacterium]
MTRVAVVGATGYAGAELVRILSGHPKVELSVLTSRQHVGVSFDKIYPSLSGHVDLICEDYSADRVSTAADVIFTALPHKIPMEIVPELMKRNKKVIDLSADFRFKEAVTYEAFYQPHTAKDLLETAVYGLSEIYPKQIQDAKLVGNPGCYPTSVILPLVPLLKKGWIDHGAIIADSKSGVSGAGRSLSLASHFCEVSESFKAYKVGEHRHNPEMEEVLSVETGKRVNVTFVPHLVPMSRGMLTTIYARPTQDLTLKEIRNFMVSSYANCPFVRICPEDSVPNTLFVRGTNYCDIGFNWNRDHTLLVIISAIDNLVKGAAGQAVQNMNLMLGFEETTGLDAVPFPL